MTASVNPSDFRRNLYGFIKHVSETGDPVEIQTQQGAVLQLTRVQNPDRFAHIVAMPGLMAVDPEELVATDWSQDWDADAAATL